MIIKFIYNIFHNNQTFYQTKLFVKIRIKKRLLKKLVFFYSKKIFELIFFLKLDLILTYSLIKRSFDKINLHKSNSTYSMTR